MTPPLRVSPLAGTRGGPAAGSAAGHPGEGRRRAPELLLRPDARAHGHQLEMRANLVTAFIGPSGCGKSTFLRTLNRMNEIIPSERASRARVLSTASRHLRARRGRGRPAPPGRHGVPEVEPVPQVDLREHRLRPADQRLARSPRRLEERVEESLRGRRPVGRGEGPARRTRPSRSRAASSSACASPGRWRCRPEILLMDEPASALDPIATQRIEDLIHELKKRLHDRHRHAQHAAGRPRLRLHGVLLAGSAGRVRAGPSRSSRRPTRSSPRTT